MKIDAVAEDGKRLSLIDRVKRLFLLEGDGGQQVLELYGEKEGQQPMGVGDQRVGFLAVERNGRIHFAWYFVVDCREYLAHWHSC